ncbi:MAG: gliding motility-associated C-terminal domain-containing protein [Saprospiraceae bacterium]
MNDFFQDTATTLITVLPQFTITEEFTFCSGSTVIVNEVEYFAETQLFTTLSGVAGTCDTLLETRIIEIPVPQSVQIDLETCSNDMVVYEGQMLSPGTSTTFTLTAANGCDSTVIVAVSAFYFEQTADYTICAGDSVLVSGNYYSDAGNYQDTLASVTSACDTILNFSIAVNPYQTASDTYSVCDSILINNNYYTPGNYRDTISSLTGCDTIYEYIVTGLNVPMVAATIDTCPGAVLSYGGQPIPAGTTATVSLTAANGCDSLITLTVTPDLTYATALRLAACDGELATYNGTSLAIGDTLDFPFLSTAGCDSIVTVSVVEQNDYGEFLGPDTTVCGLEYFLFSPDTATFWTGGTRSSQLGITATGTYTATFQDALGCVITDDIFVKFPLRDTYLPNAFSPNGDGINDCFQPLFPAGLEFLTYNLTIFNRWGAPVYSSTSPQACWNGTFRGKSAQAGVYVWMLESVNAVCRETDSRSGSVTLVR